LYISVVFTTSDIGIEEMCTLLSVA